MRNEMEEELLDVANLRRLYHHLSNGGKTTEDDDRRAGFKVTLESLADRIEQLEQENRGREYQA